MATTCYANIYLHGSRALTCAGDGAAALALAEGGDTALSPGPDGWAGRLAAASLSETLVTVCREPWRQVVDPADPLPAIAITTSKGDTAAWLPNHQARPARLVAGLAGGPPGPVLRQLGIRLHRPLGPVAACATGLYALLAVADELAAGRSRTGLAAVADRSLQPLLVAGFTSLGVLCGDTRPTALDGRGTGFAPAEGAAAISLARAPGSWLLRGGVRLGDAGHPTRCQDAGMLDHLLAELWRILPEPDRVVVHGTGTRIGDAFELAGLERGPWRRRPRLVFKPAIGHTLGASSLVELACALAGPDQRLWKLALGFGGHAAGVALERCRDST